jgi:hypothetical protein
MVFDDDELGHLVSRSPRSTADAADDLGVTEPRRYELAAAGSRTS